MSSSQASTLLTWIAVNNDPFERERDSRAYRIVDGKPVLGPTLTLLSDPDSPYAGKINEVVIFHRDTVEDSSREDAALDATIAEIKKRCPRTSVIPRPWAGADPTDHLSIFSFLRKEIPAIRRSRPDQNLVVHISPGTPTMHTIWVLMVETGMIEPPVELVKSYRKAERQGRPAVVQVHVGLDTFFQVYRKMHAHRAIDAEDRVFWDPQKFRSPKLKQVFQEARRFAQVKVPLLILGERGTGKTTLAGWIRTHSAFRKPKNDAHWPAVPCGQYSAETMRAELFGYRKGAFTGAVADKEGLLAVADGDTLFLDEIGDIAGDLQRLLIKAVEEQTYSPLGSTETLHSDFRLISATNRPLARLQEKLDPDFLDRVGMLRLEMPPLRDLPQDLDWLWDQVLAEAEKRAGNRLSEPGRDEARRAVLGELKKHVLPGNLRDLFVAAYRLIACMGDAFEPLPATEAGAYAIAGLVQTSDGAAGITSEVLRRFLDNQPLDPVLRSDGELSTDAVLNDLRRYMAREIRRYARTSGRKLDDICDVADRTLREWAK
jgi:DNA-binding NtrC family response regulator